MSEKILHLYRINIDEHREGTTLRTCDEVDRDTTLRITLLFLVVSIWMDGLGFVEGVAPREEQNIHSPLCLCGVKKHQPNMSCHICKQMES